MQKTISFLELFGGFTPPEALAEVLAQARVCHVQIDQASRAVSAALFSETYLTQRQLRGLEQDLQRHFGIRRVALSAAFPGELLASMDALHGSCRLAAPGGDVVPGGLDIPPPSWAERALWTGLGLLLQPVRVLV